MRTKEQRATIRQTIINGGSARDGDVIRLLSYCDELEQRVTTLEEALRPLADEKVALLSDSPDDAMHDCIFTYGQIRRAAKALEGNHA